MKMHHEGLTFRGLTGGGSAAIKDDGSYVEIVLVDADGDVQSFDLNGFGAYIEELTSIKQQADAVDRFNRAEREGREDR